MDADRVPRPKIWDLGVALELYVGFGVHGHNAISLKVALFGGNLVRGQPFTILIGQAGRFE